jgi:hypothetical protein
VLVLHNRNKSPSVLLAHAANMKESYQNMKLVMEKIQYEKYNWNICGDLKVTAFLFGFQLGYKTFCWFLFDLDCRDRKHNYMQTRWPR